VSRGGRLRVAFVVQRYGREVNGGAEHHCRLVAEHMVRSEEVEAVHVFTTCALDYVTWDNHYEPGTEEIEGVQVERFASTRTRRKRTQVQLAGLLMPPPGPLANPVARFQRRWPPSVRWLGAQGPVVPSLLSRLDEVGDAFDAFVFFTYLYYPTVRGLERVPAPRRVLVPTAHDEPEIRLHLYRRVFALPAAFAFNTDAERDFVMRQFEVNAPLTEVIGCGVELSPPETGRLRDRPYLLYLGRLEANKGIRELARAFRFLKRTCPDASLLGDDGARYRVEDLQLVVVGGGKLRLPRHRDIVREGFVSEPRKRALMEGCEALVLPSRFESLSLVILEGWTLGRPVVVERECEVLAGHVRACGGGICYHGRNELAEALVSLLSDPSERRRMGEAGRRYVEGRYTWPRVEERWLSLLHRLVTQRRSES
jgi:glycosyltransferase involved in cell wall biosynthesis